MPNMTFLIDSTRIDEKSESLESTKIDKLSKDIDGDKYDWSNIIAKQDSRLD